jgi:hypothetical protein
MPFTRRFVLALAGALFFAAMPGYAKWRFWEPKGRPDWIDEVAAREKAFPRAQYLVGVGAADAASRLEGDKRIQAEQVACARIRQILTSGLDATLQQATIDVLMGACRTERIFFDETGGKWYVLVALDIRAAGRACVEAAEARLAAAARRGTKGTGSTFGDYLRAVGQSAQVAALDDLLTANRLLGGTVGELTVERVANFKLDQETQVTALASNVSVRIAVEDLDGRPAPADVVKGFERILAAHRVPVVAGEAPQALLVTLTTESDPSLKELNVSRFRTGGSYVLREGERDLVSHRLPPNANTEATSSSESVARQRSLLLLLKVLAEHFEAALAALAE